MLAALLDFVDFAALKRFNPISARIAQLTSQLVMSLQLDRMSVADVRSALIAGLI